MSNATDPDQEAMDEWGEFMKEFADEHGSSTLYYAISTSKIAFDEKVREDFRGFTGTDGGDFKIDDDLF